MIAPRSYVDSVSATQSGDALADQILRWRPSSRISTFPENQLRWVPRKRHNSRHPIAPLLGDGNEPMAASTQQPLAEPAKPAVSVDSTTVAEDAAQRADDKQMRRRSTRRLSRRVSLAPIQEEDEASTIGSAKNTGRTPSHAARRVSVLTENAACSPTKVACSPRKLFTVTATPSKVLLAETPRRMTGTPAKSSRKSSRKSLQKSQSSPSSPPPSSPLPAGRNGGTDDPLVDLADLSGSPPNRSSLGPEMAPLVFDQPTPQVQAEPAHETSRRVTLQNARRSDRRRSSLGGRGTISARSDFDGATQGRPSRRRSSTHLGSGQSESKASRRHTLNVFGGSDLGTIWLDHDSPPTQQQLGPMDPMLDPTASSQCQGAASSTAATSDLPAAGDLDAQAAVIVDVGTNLDIFGQGPESSSPRLDASFLPSSSAAPDEASHVSHMDLDGSSLQAATPAVTLTQPQHVTSSPIPDLLGLSIQAHAPERELAGCHGQDLHCGFEHNQTVDSDPALPAIEDGSPRFSPLPRPVESDAVPAVTPLALQDQLPFCDATQDDTMFLPHDPEGLSTIFEESFAADPLKSLEDRNGPHERNGLSPIDRTPDAGLPATGTKETQAPAPAPHHQPMEKPSSSPTSSPLPQQSSPTPRQEDVKTLLSPCRNTLNEKRGVNLPPWKPRGNASLSPAPTSPPPLRRSPRPRNNAAQGADHGTSPASDAIPPRSPAPIHSPLASNHLVNRLSPRRASTLPTSPPLESDAAIIAADAIVERRVAISSPTPSDDSVATPEDDDICGLVTLDVTGWDQDFQQSPYVQNSASGALVAASVSNDNNAASSPSPGRRTPTLSRATVTVSLSPLPKDSSPQKGHSQGTSSAGNDSDDAVPETPPGRGIGFTAVNTNHLSSPPPDVTTMAPDTDDLDDMQNDYAITAFDYEPTVPISDVDDGITEDVPLCDTDPSAVQEDSETEMLRKFVTRVKAGKSAKAAAASTAKRSLRPKRRSGSNGSNTSTTGSPIAKFESPTKRMPLCEKDLNSPSPAKKRKQPVVGDGEIFKGATLFSEDPSPPPKTKRRRKRLDAELETTLEEAMSFVDSDAPAKEAGLRRSTRSTRSSRVPLNRPAPTANSAAALSMIPVRLPGSSGAMCDLDRDMPAVVIPKKNTEDKDLAAVTRVNTRKNKAGAAPPKVVLARQAEDPTSWRMKELQGVFDAKEERAEAEIRAEAEGSAITDDTGSKGGRKTRRGKGVRWAEELVRFQGDRAETVPIAKPAPATASSRKSTATAAVSSEEPAPKASATPVSPDKPEPQQLASQQQQQQQQDSTKKPPSRRTRASRLQMPTPIRNNKAATGTGAKADKSSLASAGTGAQAAAKKGIGSSASSSSSSSGSSSQSPAASTLTTVRMTTRRSRIASLGMSANGTPAPKRRSKTVL